MKISVFSCGLTSVQVRMARAGLGLTVRELAQLAGLNKATIVRIEAGEPVSTATARSVRDVLETHGVMFDAEEGQARVSISLGNEALQKG